jgi:hypothetical protein
MSSFRFAIPLCTATAQETASTTDGKVDDLSLMGGDKRIDQFLAVGFQGHWRTLLVRAHESRVADYIGGDDRSKVTL